MTSTTWLDLSRRPKAWRPRPLRRVLQDMAGVARQPEQAHRTHLRATLEWLCRAQDASVSVPGSVAAGWTFASGWLPGDMDVGGRLIETCLPAADAKYFSDALMMDMVGIAIPPAAQKVESA